MSQIKKIVTLLCATVITFGTLAFFSTHAYATVVIEGKEEKMFLPKNYTVGDVAKKLDLDQDKVKNIHSRDKKIKEIEYVTEFRFYKDFSIVVDGVHHEGVTTELSVSDLVNSLDPDFDSDGAHISEAEDSLLIDVKSKEQIVASSVKVVPLVVANEEMKITTNAPTVQDVLDELGVEVLPDDEVSKPLDDFVERDEEIEVIEINIKNKTVEEESALPVKTIEDASLAVGSTKIVSEGEPRIVEKEMELIYANGELRERVEVSRSVLSKGRPKIVAHGKAPATKAPGGATCGGWKTLIEKYFGASQVSKACRVMMCESRGNPIAQNPRSTASGLFQFLDGTWRSARQAIPDGSKYARAKDAPAELQIIAAAKWQRKTSWSQWSCK